MKYLIRSSNLDKGLPQIEGIVPMSGNHYKKITSFGNEEVDFSELPPLIFLMEKESKLTDFISQSYLSAQGLLVSEKVYSIVKSYKLFNFQVARAIVRKENNDYSYYWLHPREDCVNFLNFTSTGFYIIDIITDEEYSIKIRDYKHYVDKRFSLSGLKKLIPFENNIYMDKSLAEYDICLFTLNSSEFYISDKLKEELEKNNVTGYEIFENKFNFKFPN